MRLSLALLCVAASAQAREARHGATTIRWNTERLSIVSGGIEKVIFQHREENNKQGDVIEQQSGAVLSVVGPWVSIAKSWYSEGGAHPSYGTHWSTIDVVKGGKVSLSQLFSDEVLLAALSKHPVLLKGQRAVKRSSLAAFLGSLDGDCQMTLNESLLKQWAFHELKVKSVAIQIGISYGYEVCRGQFTKVVIELPIPPALKAHLDEANQRKTLRVHLENKPKPPPAEAGLEVVHVQGDQLFTTNLKTKKTKALNLGKRKVLTASQDADGNWWVVTQKGTWIELARIPIGLEAHRRKPLLGQMQAGTGHYKLVFPDKTTFTMTDFSTRRNAAERCGDWSDKWLCDESMGWTEHKTRTYPLKKERLAEWGIPIPSQATKPVVTSGPPPKPFRRVPCQCWGSDFGCGKSTPLGNTGLRLLVTDVECGDLAHPSCVAESADKRSYALFSFADLAKKGRLKWISGDKITPKKEGPFGSCGPFYFSADGRWVTDGKGVFCTLDQPAVCTPKLKGDFLGTTGLPLRVIELR